jgi:hypothetical protein
MTLALALSTRVPGAAAAGPVVGPPQTVFDWSTQACEPNHIPDLPARAFRDDQGRVQLIMAHFRTRRLVGPNLGHLSVDCTPTFSSSQDADPAAYNDREWIASIWTDDGKNVDALVHDEYQGDQHPGMCPQASYFPCWYNAITFARSTNGGNSFTQPAPPHQLVASTPYPYLAGAGPYGYFEPSNIVQSPTDGYYYAMMHAEEYGLQGVGTCLMRTRTPDNPASWRGWSGSGFAVQFVDPYQSPAPSPAGHICARVAFGNIATMHESLTYNTYLQRYLLAGSAAFWNSGLHAQVPGFYYSTSKDLIHWGQPTLLMRGPLPWTYRCGGANPIEYPSLIDPTSASRTFSTTGRQPYLYYTRLHYRDCHATLDRDLVRVPLQLSK